MYEPVQLGPRPTRPLERVEIDHTKLPLFVVDTDNRMPIGTPWLTSAVDKYSGVPLGYYTSFEPPSYLSVMQCLLHAITPKSYLHSRYPSVEHDWETYGLPEVIVVDNGKEFYSTHLEDACLQLGIVIQYSPPKMPWYKSAIERYFGALNSQLLSDQPGKSFANFMKSYDYEPTENAVISFEALQEILHIFIVDIHNQSSHPEYKSPRAQVWNRAITSFPPALPPSNKELSILMGSIITRTLTRRGIEFEGLLYNSTELARHRSRVAKSAKLTVKYDPTDLSRLYVFDPTTYQFIEIPAINQEYTQRLTLWQHRVIKQLARQEAEKVDIVALILAKEKIQAIVEREWKTTKKGKTRQAMARWLGIGRKGIKTEGEKASKQELPSRSRVNQKAEIISPQSNLIAEISDLGSAFNPSPTDADQVNLENIKVAINPCLAPPQKSTKKLKKQANESKIIQQETDKPEENGSATEIWQPDLSGWDVSYGLPK